MLLHMWKIFHIFVLLLIQVEFLKCELKPLHLIYIIRKKNNALFASYA